MDNPPNKSADEGRNPEQVRTLFDGVISEVNTTHFVLGTGGARFFFPPGAPLTQLKVGDSVTVKAVRAGSKYVAEAVTLNSRPNPICSICRKAILAGVGRLRRGLTSVHIDCEKGQLRRQSK